MIRSSSRGYLLAFQGEFPPSPDRDRLTTLKHHLSLSPASAPVVTVELAEKWYDLWLCYPTNQYQAVGFPDEGRYDELGSPFIDHIPNPRHVVAWAARMGYRVDTVSLELIAGRWELEKPTYDSLHEMR